MPYHHIVGERYGASRMRREFIEREAEERAAGDHLSSESGTRAGVVFDNMSDVTVQLFQLTAQGRTLRDTLRPWIASYQRDTVAGSA